MIHLSAWLRPPRFADEEKTRQAFLLNIIVWVLIIVPIPFLVYTQLFSPEAWRRVLTQVLSGEAVNVFLLVLLRRGYVRIASIIQIAAFWAFFTATAWTGAGIYTQAYQIGQALVICIAGFLIGVHGALIMVGVSLLSGGLMVAAADMGWWSFNPPDKALTVWVVSAVLFPVLAVVQYLAGRLLRTALAQSRMSKAQYRNLVQHIPMRIFIKDLNSVYVSCNPNYARDLGIEPEQIVGKDDFAFYGRELAEGYRADDRSVVGGEAPKEVEEKYVVSGRELWIHTIKVPYRDHEGHVVGALGIFEDITDRRRAEEMLRGSEERFRSLVETTSDWIWETDAEDRYTYASPQSRHLLGYEPEEIVGRKPFDLMTPEEAERVWAEFERSRSAKRPFHNLENVNLRKDGRKVVLETSGVPRLDSHGNFLGYRGIDRDITERKRAEEILREYKKVIESSQDMIAVVDRNYNYLIVNNAFLKYRGVGSEQIIGRPVSEVLGKDVFEEHIKKNLDACLNGKVVQYGMKYTYPELGKRDLSVSYFPVEGPEGINRVASVIRDITEMRCMEEKLQESEMRRHLSAQILIAQENERRMIAHEIHDGFGSQLATVKYRVEDFLRDIDKNGMGKLGESLESVLPVLQESLLEVRRIQMNLRPSILDDLGVLPTIEWFCREFEETYPSIRIEKEILVEENDISPSLKVVIYRTLQEAMNNIAKHSEADLASLSLLKTEGKVELLVQDNGRGFDLKKATGSENSRQGFGLISMRERTELSGGSFSIDSIEGEGTTIRAWWPLLGII